MKILKNKKVFLPILGFVLAIIAFIGFSYSEILENDVEVEPNSYLTYYLDVNYDGVDRNGVESSDTTTAEINSGYINVSDKIPDGLTFEGFVATSDGSIGAVQRSDEMVIFPIAAIAAISPISTLRRFIVISFALPAWPGVALLGRITLLPVTPTWSGVVALLGRIAFLPVPTHARP